MDQDTFDPQRFLNAQEPIYDTVRRELLQGSKRSHWMWFIFPQIEGLGYSAMSQRYALANLQAAQAFAAHPILGARLKECVALVNRVHGKSALQILGSPDDLKFCSSMTLFSLAVPNEPSFKEALDKFFGGRLDALTLAKVGSA